MSKKLLKAKIPAKPSSSRTDWKALYVSIKSRMVLLGLEQDARYTYLEGMFEHPEVACKTLSLLSPADLDREFPISK